MVQVLLIAMFVTLFLRESLARPILDGVSDGEVAGLYFGGVVAISLLLVAVLWSLGRRLDRTGSPSAVRRADAAVLGSRVAALVLHAFAVLGMGWLDVVRRKVGDLVLIDELLAVAPAFLVFVVGWWAMYPIDRRLREAVLLRELDEGRTVRPMPGRWAYVLNALRHQAALVLVPVILISGWMEAVGIGISKLPRMGVPPWLPAAAAQLVGMALVLTMMPLVLRRVWSTVVLDPGPLRDRLTQMCVRQKVKVRELLVWGTHGTMINGAVMGFVGPVRYILLTDALLDSLPQTQVEAVMAHELGHVKRRHMIWLGIAAVSAITLAQLGINSVLAMVWGERVLVNDGAQAGVALAALLAGLAVFGYISRRFEWQADAFAVQHLSDAPVISEEAAVAMAGALESVARLNRIPREKFTWRHGSIGTRQRKIVALTGRPTDALPIDRQTRWLKLGAAAALATAIGVVVWTTLHEATDAREERHALREDARDR